MKKLNKALYSVGSLVAVASPMAAVVACGSGSDTISPAMENGKVVVKNVHLALDGSGHSANDKSFNEQGKLGIQKFISGTLADGNILKPAAPDGDPEFKQMYANAPKGSTIVAPGFSHISPLKSAGEEINGKNIILVDGTVKKPNIASVEFKVEQAAYLAGYALAMDASTAAGFTVYNTISVSENKVRISTFGGMDFPTVSGFMGGFQKGIEAGLAKAKTDLTGHPQAANVEFVKFANRAEHFSGGFNPGGGKTKFDKMKAENIDIVLPVAGPQTGDVGNVTGYTPFIIGVDTPQETFYTEGQLVPANFVFSILKKIKEAVSDVLHKVAGDTVADASIKGLNETTVGTLENGLVGISDNTAFSRHAEIKVAYEAAKNDATVKAAALAMDPNFFYA